MKMELDAESERYDEDFKNLVFANDPILYKRLFMEPIAPEFAEPQESDLYLPQTVGDVANLLADLKGLGLDLSGSPLPT